MWTHVVWVMERICRPDLFTLTPRSIVIPAVRAQQIVWYVRSPDFTMYDWKGDFRLCCDEESWREKGTLWSWEEMSYSCETDSRRSKLMMNSESFYNKINSRKTQIFGVINDRGTVLFSRPPEQFPRKQTGFMQFWMSNSLFIRLNVCGYNGDSKNKILLGKNHMLLEIWKQNTQMTLH